MTTCESPKCVKQMDSRLFVPQTLRLSETYSDAAPIFLDKMNSCSFKCGLQFCARFIGNVRAKSTFKPLNSRQRQACFRGEFGLRPAQKASRRTDLFNRNLVNFALIHFGSSAMIHFGSLR
jgi:hypothetical protein